MRCLFILLCVLVLAAAPPPKHRNEIHVPVWTGADNDRSGRGLEVRDLNATLEGAPARIRSVLGPGTDLMVLLVMDLVGDFSLVDEAKRSLAASIGKLPDNVYAGLMQAQDGLKVLRDPTVDREEVAAAIQVLPVSGKPGLLDTVETALKIADEILENTAVRIAVFYVTDSDVREYREDFTNPVINNSDWRDLSRRFPEGLIREKISKLDQALAAFEAPLFVVHLDYRSERLNEAYQAGLLQLAVTTGGTSLFCRSSTEIPEAIRKTFELMTSLYRVDIELPDRHPKIIQLKLESASHQLSYRQRFLLNRR